VVERDVLRQPSTLGRTAGAPMGTLPVCSPDCVLRSSQLCALPPAAGVRKTYWISCVVERDVLAAAIDPGAYPSSIVASPRDLNRLLANFQPTLGEITVIATEAAGGGSLQGSAPSDEGGPETRAVELRSYVDPSASRECGFQGECVLPYGDGY